MLTAQDRAAHRRGTLDYLRECRPRSAARPRGGGVRVAHLDHQGSRPAADRRSRSRDGR